MQCIWFDWSRSVWTAILLVTLLHIRSRNHNTAPGEWPASDRLYSQCWKLLSLGSLLPLPAFHVTAEHQNCLADICKNLSEIWLDGQDSVPGYSVGSFLLITSVEKGISWAPRALFSGTEQLWRDSDQSIPTSIEVKNAWSLIYTSHTPSQPGA